MKKGLFKMVAGLLCVGLLCVSSACGNGGHECTFDNEIRSAEYLKSEANCQSGTQYYYSCDCGEHGSETFEVGAKTSHQYTAEVAEERYMKTAANCQSGAEYYKSCVTCGKRSSLATFIYGEKGSCKYDKEIVKGEYLKSEATTTQSAVYYKSCICGSRGEETFSYGETLRDDYTDEEKATYTPTSLTVSLYDAENSIYGFTYNTQVQPLRPVIQIAEGNELGEDYKEYSATVEKATSYDADDAVITYYIVKTEIELEAENTYAYRAWDKYVGVGTDTATLQTVDTRSTAFTFAHISDSQTKSDNDDPTLVGSGEYFGRTLSQIVGENDFIVHTGDVVEWSKYEGYWTAMLDANFSYLSQIPVMAISGNHDTTYRNGKNETYKHFHHKIPEQNTDYGYYYSFVYGNAKFIMLNSNSESNAYKLEEQQYEWLVNELENNTCTWTIVAIHQTIFSAGAYSSNPSRNAKSLALRAQLQNVFAEYGVDIVLQGHEHVISRSYPINGEGEPQTETWQTENGVDYSVDPNGVIYVTNGPAGNQTRSPYVKDSPLYSYAKSSQACSWAEFAVDGNTLKVTVQYYDGESKQSYATWGIKKSAA